MQSRSLIRTILGLLVAGAFVYFSFFAGGYGSKVTNGTIEVYYKDGATKEEAERLAAHLATIWPATPDRRSVQISKNGDAFRFRMVVKPEFHNDSKFLANLGIFGAQLSRSVFNGVAVEVEACDQSLNTVKAIPVPADFRHGIVRGKIELFHSAAVSKEDATKLMDFLEKDFAAAPAPLLTFTLGKRGGTHVVSMGFNMELLKQPEVLAELRGFRERLSKIIFNGEPLELQTCDDSFNVTETFKP